ncbi:glutathione S-transferase C-terminal domain-containing protein, partial [Klebsiella pneumoniae]
GWDARKRAYCLKIQPATGSFARNLIYSTKPGNQLTEADIRLWTTLVRFDPVYVTHFKCDKRRISDYLNLYGFLRDIYQMPGIAETVSFPHIRHHYYRSHKTINPTGIISIGPQQDLNEPHGRDQRFR